VTKLGNGQRNQFGTQAFNGAGKYPDQPYGQTYQPLQSQTYDGGPGGGAHMVQNQAYQRNTSHYAATTNLPYQGYNKGKAFYYFVN